MSPPGQGPDPTELGRPGTDRAEQTEPPALTLQRLGRALLILLGPLLAGLVMATLAGPGGSVWPWRPPTEDLEVYLLAGRTLRTGGDIYALEGFPFIYPPVAALVAAALSWLPTAVVQASWTAASVLAMLALCHRLGLRGWRLSLVSVGSIILVTPVATSLALGQVSIWLCTWIVLDLLPGPRLLKRRRLPQGWLVGLGAAIKLTPAIFVPYLLLTGRRRAALCAVGVFLGLGLIGLVLLPGESVRFWAGLAAGDTGLGDSIIFVDNQSLMGSTLRWSNLASWGSIIGLLGSALAATLGLIAALRWHRRGEQAWAVCLLGVASLVASPVSWTHHFVWVVPLAVVLVRRHRQLPRPLSVIGLGWSAWLVLTPYRHLLPGGDWVELTYTVGQDVLDSVTVLLGLALLISAATLRSRGRADAPA